MPAFDSQSRWKALLSSSYMITVTNVLRKGCQLRNEIASFNLAQIIRDAACLAARLLHNKANAARSQRGSAV